MKYLNDFFELCYEIVIYRDKFSDIDIEVMCRIYFGSSCIWYCDICKFFLCVDCKIEYCL